MVFFYITSNTKIEECDLCGENFDCLVMKCLHRVCGECAFQLLTKKSRVMCFQCNEMVNIQVLGDFVDGLQD